MGWRGEDRTVVSIDLILPCLANSSSETNAMPPPSSSESHPSPSKSSLGSSKSSLGSSWLRSWTKFGSFAISPGRKNNGRAHSNLTEEGLEAHNNNNNNNNNREEKAEEEEDASAAVHILLLRQRNARCSSPYYKGLTDASLIIKRNKTTPLTPTLLAPPSPGGSGRESNSTSASFILKLQHWGSSCLSSSKSTPTTYKSSPSTFPNIITTTTTCSVSECQNGLSLVSNTESSTGLEDPHSDHNIVKSKEKPLRERVVLVQQPTDINDDESHGGSANPDQPAGGDEMNATGSSGRGFAWADKYQPKALTDFICNQDKAAHVQALMKEVNCNHFIFEGPAGVGKRTMIRAMLQEAFGQEMVKTKEKRKTFNLKGETVSSIKVKMEVSSQHIEVNLSDMKGYEKHVIVEIIKETHNRISNMHQTLSSLPGSCQAIVLYEADKLTTEAQLYIKWLLERYKGYSKFFFCCSDVSQLEPIKELCTVIKLSPPSHAEIVKVLEFIAKREGIEVTHQLAERIASESKNNLRQAIRSFEATWRSSYPFTQDQVILCGWENDIANIATNMIQEQSPKQLYIIRGKLQSLIEHDVSTDYIFESLARELKDQLGETFHLRIDSMLQQYYKSDDGNWLDARHGYDAAATKKIDKFTRIEEYIAKFMSFYKCTAALMR